MPRLQTAVAAACALGARWAYAVANNLNWPFDVGGAGYYYQGSLGAGASDTFALAVPIFPNTVYPTLFTAMTMTIQCTSCWWASCLTVSSTGGGCSEHYCDADVHTCTDTVPYSNDMLTTYTLTITNDNSLSFDKTYTVGISQACSAGSALDENACMPVTVGSWGTYRSACVFATAMSTNGLMFGVDGCSCVVGATYYSNCWNGYVPQPVTTFNGVETCAPPMCLAPPSPAATPSQTPTTPPPPSHTPSSSNTPSVCPSPLLHSPSPTAPPPSQPFSLGSLQGPAAVAAVAGTGAGALVMCAVGAFVWRWRSQPRTRRVRHAPGDAIALTAATGGEVPSVGMAAPLLRGAGGAGARGTGGAVCRACRAENDPSARFCVECGAALTV